MSHFCLKTFFSPYITIKLSSTFNCNERFAIYVLVGFVPLADLLHSPEEEHSFGFHDRPDEAFGGGGGGGGGLAPITDEGSEWTSQ